LRQGYPAEPTGHVARHLTTLAALISGIVASKSTQMPKVAAHVPDGTKPESRVTRFARWVGNPTITEEVYFVPYAPLLLPHLAMQTLVLVMDGSVVGRGCVALMLHVVYQGRALPLVWLVRPGKKGHCPEDLPIALLAQVQRQIPVGTQVVLLGDGEVDGTTLQQTVQDYHWAYGVRTGSNLTVLWDGETFRGDTVASCIQPGTIVELTDGHMTQAAYGPVMLICCWAKGYQEPLHLVTNTAIPAQSLTVSSLDDDSIIGEQFARPLGPDVGQIVSKTETTSH
jgi:hypothetical protein